METPKRKYQKRKTESKISVRHYLNTNLKGKKQDGKICYPIYVQIIHKGKTNYVKSLLKTYVELDRFDEYKEWFSEELAMEKYTIENKVKMLSDAGQTAFTLKHIYNEEELYAVIDDCIKLEIRFALFIKDTQIIDYMSLLEVYDTDFIVYLTMLVNENPIDHLFDWKNKTADFFIKNLLSIFPDNATLISLDEAYLLDIPFYDMYLDVCKKYYNGANVVIEKWQTGDFQEHMRTLFMADESKLLICKYYIFFITSLLKKYKRM